MDGLDLPVSTQAALLDINRSTLYYEPVPHSRMDLEIKLQIDKVYTKYPEYGYRRICWYLNTIEHIKINHKAVLRHMQEMGIQAIYPRPNTSKPNPLNKIYPYLLKGLNMNHVNHVWSIDITYIPVKTDWLYLVAIIDWYSRYVLSWEVSDRLDNDFVVEASRNALRINTPEIMNSDQGSNFTSPVYTNLFLEAGARISMDHRGRAFDNIFIERLWRTVKYENVYPQGYETPRDARMGLNKFLKHYNTERPHSSLDYRTPAQVYFGS